MSNQLSFSTVETAFLKQYPTGTIYRTTPENKSKYTINVSFTPEGKVDTYNVNNNIDALKRLKLADNLIYKRDYDYYTTEIEKLTKEIKKGYYINDLFGEGETINYTPNDIRDMEYNIKCWNAKIANKTII